LISGEWAELRATSQDAAPGATWQATGVSGQEMGGLPVAAQ